MDWLLKENSEFTERYKDSDGRTNFSNRVESVNPRVRDCIEDLVHLELLIARPGVARGDNDTTEYKFTHFGYIISLLLDYDRAKSNSEKDTICDEILDAFQFYWSIQHSSIDLFCSIFYVKLNKAGLFEGIINHYKSVLHKQYIHSRNDFFRELMLVRSEDESSIKLWQIFEEALGRNGENR